MSVRKQYEKRFIFLTIPNRKATKAAICSNFVDAIGSLGNAAEQDYQQDHPLLTRRYRRTDLSVNNHAKE